MNAILPLRADPAEVPTVYDLAKTALVKAKQAKALNEELEQLKPIFRKHGETIVIPGVGKVTYKKGNAPEKIPAHTAYAFNVDAYNKLLSKEQKALLKRLGVITTEQVPEATTSGTQAGIGYAPNV